MIVPKTIPECFTFLKVLVDEPYLEAVRNRRREELVDCQHDLGMFIRNNWLYSGASPLIRTFKFMGMGDYEEDSLSALIIEEFWEHLNGLEYNELVFAEKLKRRTLKKL